MQFKLYFHSLYFTRKLAIACNRCWSCADFQGRGK